MKNTDHKLNKKDILGDDVCRFFVEKNSDHKPTDSEVTMEDTGKILVRLKYLKERPKMIIPISSIDYLALKIYIVGYIDGISLALDKELVKDISVWFNKKISQQYSISWIDIVPSYYKGKNDDELKEILLDITMQYFRENPNWYKSE